MKYATSAALSLVLSLGLAAAAQAQGTQPTSPSNPPPAASQSETQGMQPGTTAQTAPPMQGETQETQPGTAAEASPAQGETQQMQPGATAEASPAAEQLSPSTIKGAQRALKKEGLYHGNIDGVVGPRTQQAVAEFQQQHNLQPTGQLTADTISRLTGVGVGSSMPNVGTQPETGPGQPMPGAAAEPTPPSPGGGNSAPMTAPGTPPAR